MVGDLPLKARFEITGRLPGLNETTNENRKHWSRGAKLKKEATHLCAQYVVIGFVPVFNDPVRIIFHWTEPNAKRDLDNISGGAKFILDALVQTGRLKNDTRQWVKSIAHHFPDPDKANPRIAVEIETI